MTVGVNFCFLSGQDQIMVSEDYILILLFS